MEKLHAFECEVDPALQNFDHLYGTLKRLTKTETDIRKLKSIIDAAKKKLPKNSTSLCQTCDLEKRIRRSPSSVVISKVSKTYARTCPLPKTDLVSKKQDCPYWLSVFVEGYSAILQCFWEVKEELKLICNKYMKQENTYSSMCDSRIKHLNEEYNNDITKFEHQLLERYGGQCQTLTDQIDEYQQHIQNSIVKKERLSSMCVQIHKEVQEMESKHSGVYSELRIEGDIYEGTAGRMQRCSTATLENRDCLRSLECELDVLTTNTVELRTFQYFNVHQMRAYLQEIQSNNAQVIEKKNDLESEILTSTEIIKQFSEIVNNLKVAKIRTIETLCEREKEMAKLIEELRLFKLANPDTLDKKKRLQEEYQSVYRMWTENKNKFKAEFALNAKTLEKIKLTIFEEKKDVIVPLKLKINHYQEELRNITADCEILQEKYSILLGNDGPLSDEKCNFDSYKRLKYTISPKRMKYFKSIRSLNISTEITERHSSNPPLKQVRDGPLTHSLTVCHTTRSSHLVLPRKENERYKSKRLRDARNRVVKEKTVVSNAVPTDAIAVAQQHLMHLRSRKFTLCKRISERRIQILRVREALVLVGLAFLSSAMQLPTSGAASPRYTYSFRASSSPRRRTTAIGSKVSQFVRNTNSASRKKTEDGGTKIVLANLLPSSKFTKSMFPTPSTAYVEIPARELCENFGKLLFL